MSDNINQSLEPIRVDRIHRGNREVVMTSTAGSGVSLSYIVHAGITREYLLYVPSGYSHENNAPIVLNFHGFGGTASGQIFLSDWRGLADKHSFILIYPQGLELQKGGSHWNPDPVSNNSKSNSDDLGFISRLLKRISKKYSVDKSRVYATGYSNGAEMAYGLAHHESDTIAGIAPVSGLMNDRYLSTTSGISPVGIISFNGKEDWVRPVNGIEGYLASVSDTSSYWAEVNSSTQDVVELFVQFSGNLIERTSYIRDNGLVTVEQYLLDRGGHDWFDINIEAKNLDQLAWQFLSRLRKEGEDLVIASEDSFDLLLPDSFKRKFVDKIINFNALTDILDIDTDSFGIDTSSTFAVGKNTKEVKKVLAKQDFDFLYDQKKGGLYFNENGADKGFGDGGIIAILKGKPDLTSGNLEFS